MTSPLPCPGCAHLAPADAALLPSGWCCVGCSSVEAVAWAQLGEGRTG